MGGNPLWAGVGMCQNFRGFDIRGIPYVHINREIQGMPVIGFFRVHPATIVQNSDN